MAALAVGVMEVVLVVARVVVVKEEDLAAMAAEMEVEDLVVGSVEEKEVAAMGVGLEAVKGAATAAAVAAVTAAEGLVVEKEEEAKVVAETVAVMVVAVTAGVEGGGLAAEGGGGEGGGDGGGPSGGEMEAVGTAEEVMAEVAMAQAQRLGDTGTVTLVTFNCSQVNP